MMGFGVTNSSGLLARRRRGEFWPINDAADAKTRSPPSSPLAPPVINSIPHPIPSAVVLNEQPSAPITPEALEIR
jgi:hypothetical protein